MDTPEIANSEDHGRSVESSGSWQMAPGIDRVTARGVMEAVRSLAAHKAPGPDGLPWEISQRPSGLLDRCWDAPRVRYSAGLSG